MNGVLVDSCVLLGLFTDDVNWADWSQNTLEQYSQVRTLCINAIVYTEVSIGFNEMEEFETAISELGIEVFFVKLRLKPLLRCSEQGT